MVNIGGVVESEACEKRINNCKQACIKLYILKMETEYQKVRCDSRTILASRAACCGVWDTKKCIASCADHFRECGTSIGDKYRQLPVDPELIKVVNGRCAEYKEGSNICEYPPTRGPIIIEFHLGLLFIMTCIIVVAALCKWGRDFDRWRHKCEFIMFILQNILILIVAE